MALLIILSGPTAGQTYELAREQTQLGREQFCDLVIPIRSISRQHARIVRDSDSFFIEDLNSLNGTYVNGQRVNGRLRLRDEDRIRLFDVVLQFHERAPRTGSFSSAPTLALPKPPLGDEFQSGLRSTTIVGAIDARAEARVDVGAQAKLRAVLEITRNLGKSLEVDAFLRNMIESLFQIFPQADRGYIMLSDEATGRLVPRAVKRGRGEPSDSLTLGPISQSIAQRVMSEGKAILSTDTAASDAESSVLEGPVSSMISAPLMGPSHKPLGIIHIDTRDPLRQFSEEDLDVLISVATVAGQAVEHARMHEASIKLDRRQRELAMAQQVQLHFLPQQAPDVTGYRFYSFYRAAEDIGGDYFGYVPLADGRFAIAVGDVSGKGVSAALLMARLCAEVRLCLVTSKTPVEAICRLNREFAGPTLGDMFITFLLAVLDPREHTFTLVNAGHIPPLLRHGLAGTVEQLGVLEAGPPLGYDAEQTYAACSVRLEADDMVVMYTDGISEASDPAGQFYGIKGVYNLVARGAPDVEALGRRLMLDLERFTAGTPQSDDICLLCFARE
jgi:sigma-B regulation protein RsbU (phosphoserine phosphatase)